ncbi:MAG: hypothetical protein IJQ93_14270 [Bacteroidales bacterium]|nr:hypothetical protein [Bacteroidales bacterium]
MPTIESVLSLQEKQVRVVWDDAKEEYFFAIADVVGILAECEDYDAAGNYWRVLKHRLAKEGNQFITNCNKQRMVSPKDGKRYPTDVADKEQLFRIIQSIPSKKAEPVKMWIAKVAAERIDETIDPEIAIDRAMDTYRQKGYSEGWIKQRMEGKRTRKALTDEWKRAGVKDKEYAPLTNIILQEWSGKTAAAYKRYKGLTKENLRDNMTIMESALSTLAEAAATELHRKENPEGFSESAKVAKRGGRVAKVARTEMEKQLGYSIVSTKNAKHLNAPDSPEQIDVQ